MFLPGDKNQESSVIEQVGDYIIGHVSNSDSANPIIKLPSIFGIDMSVTKHVFMLWLVAIITSLIIILPVRKFLRNRDYKPSIMSNGIEAIVQFIRDSIVLPNVGSKWVNTWTPLVLTFFFFIRHFCICDKNFDYRIFFLVFAFVLVLCPLAGKCIRCLFPL